MNPRTLLVPVRALAPVLALTFACSPTASQAEGERGAVAPEPTEVVAERGLGFEWSGAAKELEISTVDGDIRIEPSSGKGVRVRGTKSGKDAADVEIEVDVKGDRVTIGPRYPERSRTDARVDFVVEVPAGVAVEAATVNGGVKARDVTAALKVSTVDGNISTAACPDVRGNTVNGGMTVELPKGAKRAQLEAVNGQLELRMKPDIGASVQANTVNGAIDSDFPLSRTKEVVGSHASGKLGDGSATIVLATVNGRIKLKKA
ncbi:MAG TPA: DUF4097 family beta strand repeat-containing protein [Nannocystaceae bacterium]|nr:DUF4097 family beta strand repeat-containing protein [Nannocystaceae bacterium]